MSPWPELQLVCDLTHLLTMPRVIALDTQDPLAPLAATGAALWPAPLIHPTPSCSLSNSHSSPLPSAVRRSLSQNAWGEHVQTCVWEWEKMGCVSMHPFLSCVLYFSAFKSSLLFWEWRREVRFWKRDGKGSTHKHQQAERAAEWGMVPVRRRWDMRGAITRGSLGGTAGEG